MDLNDSVVVVTGASSGIGRATAFGLASRGAAVVIAARREDRLVSLAARIREQGGRVLPVVADVTDDDDLHRLLDDALTAHGRVDALVNNAGVPGGGRLEEVDLDRIDRTIDVNFRAVVHATKTFLPAFVERHHGHIVNVASLAGRYASPGIAVYSATKHAVVAFSESLFYELRPAGVLVTAVNPGFVSTEGFPNHEVPGPFVMRPERVASGIADVIERGIAPELSIPRWVAPFQAVRVLTPPLYRWGVTRATGRFGPPARAQGAPGPPLPRPSGEDGLPNSEPPR
ncbi:MAG TPA: SDR family NAD(P)-dependent oxidoreductase [Actinomycetota bacterium]|jgi:short-subunit dehydrogenase